jgi:flavin reductase (DIM6/NTAB) family NADH-FMN oxidoreductase RutF/rubredoxin
MNKSALHKISYGLYVITSGEEGRFNGQIANTVFQVTAEPPTVAVSINKQNFTHEHIQASRRFAVSILEEGCPMTLIGRFGFKCGREIDKLSGVSTRIGKTGVPIVTDNAIAYIEAEIIKQMDCGTHTIFLGRVIDCDLLAPAAEPMTYAYYHKVKGGKSPKNAPTYQAPEEARETPARADGDDGAAPAADTGTAAATAADRYVCTVCGYLYDPAQGDPEANVPPGTPFADLPADWVCPVCGAGKDRFEKEA